MNDFRYDKEIIKNMETISKSRSFNNIILSEELAKEVCLWRYDGEYSIYNFSNWNEVVKNGWALSIKEKRESEYMAILFNNEFVAFGRIFILEGKLFLGVGLKPSKCGKGFGTHIIQKLMDEANSRYPNENIYVEVRTFNIRAKRCYEKIGFKLIDEYWKDTLIGKDKFHLMEYKLNNDEKDAFT